MNNPGFSRRIRRIENMRFHDLDAVDLDVAEAADRLHRRAVNDLRSWIASDFETVPDDPYRTDRLVHAARCLLAAPVAGPLIAANVAPEDLDVDGLVAALERAPELAADIGAGEDPTLAVGPSELAAVAAAHARLARAMRPPGDLPVPWQALLAALDALAAATAPVRQGDAELLDAIRLA